MKVRDLTEDKKSYKGHEMEAGKGGLDCPCLPCFNVHDCGYYNSQGKRVEHWDCATRYNNGCPRELGRPRHVFKHTKRFQNRKAGDVFKCIRCGQKVVISTLKFDFISEQTKRRYDNRVSQKKER